MSDRFPAVLQPLFGAFLGLCGYGLMILLPRGPGAVAAVVLWTAITLAKGERGFARWFPKLPLFGSLLAACTVLVRWYALISLQTSWERLAFGAIAAMTLGPAMAVALGWVSRPVDDTALHRLSRLTTVSAIIAIAEGTAASLLCGVRLGIVVILVSWVLVRVAMYISTFRSGVRGSDLEAFRVVVETVTLALLASLRE